MENDVSDKDKIGDVQQERDDLANAIAAAAVKAGIISADTSLTGPQLVMLCDNLAETALLPRLSKAAIDSDVDHAALVLLNSVAGKDLKNDLLWLPVAQRAVAAALCVDREKALLTDTFIQPVPDHCDRVTWRGRYYHLRAGEVETAARPLETFPKDGTLCRLLVQFTRNERDTTSGRTAAWTIGCFDPEDEVFQFAGWDSDFMHFTDGDGTVLGWLPLVDERAGG